MNGYGYLIVGLIAAAVIVLLATNKKPVSYTHLVGHRQLGGQERKRASGGYRALREGDLRGRRPYAQAYPGRA